MANLKDIKFELIKSTLKSLVNDIINDPDFENSYDDKLYELVVNKFSKYKLYSDLKIEGSEQNYKIILPTGKEIVKKPGDIIRLSSHYNEKLIKIKVDELVNNKYYITKEIEDNFISSFLLYGNLDELKNENNLDKFVNDFICKFIKQEKVGTSPNMSKYLSDEPETRTGTQQDKDNVGFINKNYTSFKFQKDEDPVDLNNRLAKLYKYFIEELKNRDLENKFDSREAREILESLGLEKKVYFNKKNSMTFSKVFTSQQNKELRPIFEVVFQKPKYKQKYKLNNSVIP